MTLSFRREQPISDAGFLNAAEIERLETWRQIHGRTFTRDIERPKRLFEITHPDRVPCIEMADRRAYGHWQFWRARVEKGWGL